MFKKICIIGEGITSLITTKMLLELDLQVDLISENFFKKIKFDNRAFALSPSNIEYLKDLKIIENKSDLVWPINEINLYNAKGNKNVKKIFNFNKKLKSLFYMIKNDDFHMKLKKQIIKNPLLNVYSKKSAKNIINEIIYQKKTNFSENYSLIINCVGQNNIDTKFFFKKIKKKYYTNSLTSIIRHQKIINDVASQFFTEKGPIAFLPLSPDKTAVVWSIKNKFLYKDKKKNEFFFKKNIKKILQSKLKIISFSNINQFELNFIITRELNYKNILNFGEGLHKIHPLAGQGLNMVIRDIKVLGNLIKNTTDLGLDLDSSTLVKFKEIIQPYNFLFATSVDLTEKYFSINNTILNKLSDEFLIITNKNYFIKNVLKKIADRGINLFDY
tara:strand:- start:356 stop:1516 length:1161 start_codon:yes stop_codon:yes gene_type:complete